MAHISLPDGLPGIVGPMAFRPETARPMNELANVLLTAPNSLSQSDRELIATYVSYLNECKFCHSCHGAGAAHHLGGDNDLVNAVRNDYRNAPISDKLKSLLAIAAKVQRDARTV